MEGSNTETSGVRFNRDFYLRDVLDVAPGLVGKTLCVRGPEGAVTRALITETEAYRGVADKACHASKGLTRRNSVMFSSGGHIYMYLIYGMYWMLNFVTAPEGNPQAVLVRGIARCYGPGRLTRRLGLDKSFYGEDATISDRIWVEEGISNLKICSGTRIGIEYAGEEWSAKPWRFFTTDLL